MAEPDRGRQFFLDNLRSALVVLVVLHHVALLYGGVAPFYYVEPPPFGSPAFQVLLVFVLVNQAWFMGAFFLLSGHFTPGSYTRKGPSRFLRDRLLRFGIPLLVFIFVLNPLASLGLYLMPTPPGGGLPPLSWSSYPDLIGLGPMWFVLMLFLFDLGYALWRSLFNTPTPAAAAFPSANLLCLTTGAFVLILATASFAVRTEIPIGKAVLGFPTLSYLPQYIGFFLVGITTARRDGLRKLTLPVGLVGLGLASIATALLFPLAFSSRFFSLQPGPQLVLALGNGHWQSAVYTLWDSTVAVGLCLGLIPLFHRFVNRSGPPALFFSRHGFTVFVTHIPVIVLIAWTIKTVALPPLAKFALASVIMVPACYGVAFLIRRFPGGHRSRRALQAAPRQERLS